MRGWKVCQHALDRDPWRRSYGRGDGGGMKVRGHHFGTASEGEAYELVRAATEAQEPPGQAPKLTPGARDRAE